MLLKTQIGENYETLLELSEDETKDMNTKTVDQNKII